MAIGSSKGRSAYVYFSIVALDSLSFCLIAPILAPLLAKHSLFFSQSAYANYQYGLLIALFPLTYMLTSPLLGYLSDRFGRKPMLLSCLLCMLCAFASYVLAFQQKSLAWLMIGRALAGIAAGSEIIAQAAMVDWSDAAHKAKAIGWIAVAMTVGLVVGPLVAGLWTEAASSLIFFVVIGVTLINMGLLCFCRMDVATMPEARNVSLTAKPHLAIRRVLPLLAIFLLFELGWSLYYQALPVMLSLQWHYDNTRIGWICAYVGAALSLFLWLGTRVGLRSVEARQLLQFAWLIGIAAFLCDAAFTSTWVMLLMVIPIVLGVALIYPLLIVAMSDTAQSYQGLVIGLSGTVLATAFTITGFLAAILAALGPALVFSVAALCWLLAWLWYNQISKR